MKGYTMNKKQAKKAFTLAELLITLSVIGLVAILTIPTMIENHQQKAWNTASTVFERKLEEALKSMNTQETLAGHANTLDFVNELAKNIKINKICNNNELTSCFEEKIHWGTDSEEIEISEIKNAKNFGQENWGTENIGIQFANGVTGIIAYNPACIQDPYNNQYTGINCVAMLYDTDGFKKPNTQLKDLRGINVKSIGSDSCAIQLSNGVCLTSPFFPEPLSKNECLEKQTELQITTCRDDDNDYWGGAVKACGGKQNMPSTSIIKQLGNDLYINEGNLDIELAKNMGFEINESSSAKFIIWSSQEKTQNVSVDMHFHNDGIYQGLNFQRSMSDRQAVCIGKKS